ncbi:hypothetical protein BJ917_1555 [Pseudomonas sp. WPR_5_2]|uniref:hypothetical protein n=1 Tax=Pseudomonas sp. WPR_5_2 TaxID=1907371 RepID=UPI000F20F823|nr:hypothetical protein [Pseudomonas sp. WPR_5_2]RKS28657.1 hypothetical protein BJ917_1555 [Pseudomonas sp. WPR_5_2]
MWIKAYHPRQNTAVRRLVFLACSAFNLISVYLVIFLAGKLTETQHVTEQGVVLLTFMLTGIQVGQAVGVQVYISKTQSPVIALMACLLALIVMSQLQVVEIFKNFILTGIGAICGYFLSYRVAFNLTSQNKWKFQALTSIRYVVIGLSVILLILSRVLSATTLIVTVVAVTIALTLVSSSSERINAPSQKKMFLGLVTILSGIVLSLIYRNDINIVRDLYSGTQEFSAVHNMLIAFSVVVAGAGFIVTNYIYTKINDQENTPRIFTKQIFSLAYGALLLMFFVALPALSPYIKIVAATLIAITCPVFSAFLHLKAKSNIVYVIGACSLLVVMFVVRQWLGMSPLDAFLLYNLTTLSLLYAVSLFFMAGIEQ